MNIPGRPKPQISATSEFDFLFGSYSRSTVKIPYFQISMNFAEADRFLKLVDDLPNTSDIGWKIEELYQRDIDYNRVLKKILPYLREDSQPTFFNSLTIALIPFKNQKIVDSTAGDWRPPVQSRDEQFGKKLNIGPVNIGWWHEWQKLTDPETKIGTLSWNTDEVFGIAIDGQHRLAAIKELLRNNNTDEKHKLTSVPIILVVLDPQLGYTGEKGRDGIIGTIRSLFIDLNKHAKIVNRARQILLDDRDPIALCVRSIIGESLTNGLSELKEEVPVIPLTLVDWHSEKAKFDDGPYLVTILGLDWIVRKVLGFNPVDDPMAHKGIESVIKNLENKLKIKLDSARARLIDCHAYSKPFAFETTEDGVSELEIIKDGFRKSKGREIIRLLTEFRPYKRLIEKRTETKTLRPEFAQWYSYRQSADKPGASDHADSALANYEKALRDREDPISDSHLSEALDQCLDIKADNSALAYTVVFQRALFLAFDKISKLDAEVLIGVYESLPSEDDELRAYCDKARVEQFLDAMNQMVLHDVFIKELLFLDKTQGTETKQQFWLGSLAAAGSVIDFSQAASERASHWLVLMCLFNCCSQIGVTESFEEFYKKVEDSDGSGMVGQVEAAFKRLYVQPKSAGGRILEARDLENEEPARIEQIRIRAEWIWEKLMA